jgi:hypothetical protein
MILEITVALSPLDSGGSATAFPHVKFQCKRLVLRANGKRTPRRMMACSVLVAFKKLTTPRVNHLNLHMFKVLHITSHQRQSMNNRRSRYQSHDVLILDWVHAAERT